MTYWHCENCKAHGCVAHFKHADVLTVVRQIEKHHKHQGAYDCEFDSMKVRTSATSLRPKRLANRQAKAAG